MEFESQDVITCIIHTLQTDDTTTQIPEEVPIQLQQVNTYFVHTYYAHRPADLQTKVTLLVRWTAMRAGM